MRPQRLRRPLIESGAVEADLAADGAFSELVPGVKRIIYDLN